MYAKVWNTLYITVALCAVFYRPDLVVFKFFYHRSGLQVHYYIYKFVDSELICIDITLEIAIYYFTYLLLYASHTGKFQVNILVLNGI